ncbi:hypothetical protein [Enterocloster citroniae]|uniref:hypothetical protein n=1 Tax=Enterocloster citroniae TaxID=358743 RepID=UPI00140AE2FE|nr:hypothetical protein [Enterocloster citroniae]
MVGKGRIYEGFLGPGGLLESTAFYWETRGWQTRQSHKSILKGIVKMPAKYFW